VSPRRRAVAVKEANLHGHAVRYRTAGDGDETIVLIHGIAGSSLTWEPAMADLAQGATVIAPDMLGHGESAKPRGDYSLGAYASGLRDLLAFLGRDRATIVGHSLGGGVAMQFAYQFPERIERLVLVDSGGLGRDVHVVLRSAALPGAEYVLPLLAAQPLRNAGEAVGRFLGGIGWRPGPDLEEVARGFGSLGDFETRRAFVHTVRSIIDPGGQRVSARDRLYLAAELPTLIVWGERDRILPVAHGYAARDAMPGSRLEIFEDAGHFPHRADPARFADVLLDFVEATEPASLDAESVRRRLREPQATG
jgi:pimeloyl-ACP methyl ester carboxylesterase